MAKCKHEYRNGIVIQNKWTNGRFVGTWYEINNTDQVERGEGLWQVKDAYELVHCDKCIHCGKTL